MKRFQTLIAILFVALLGTIMIPSAKADPWNRKTIVTFSGPVEIPGAHLKGWGVLPAGTYVFKILDSLSNRHIVQIFAEDERTLYATILAIPNSRMKATDKTVITFEERPAGQPEALHAWFYPGRLWGEEFVYPKEKASELARAGKRNVLYTPEDYPYEVDTPEQLNEEEMIASMRRAPVQAVQHTGEDVDLAQVVEYPADGPTDADRIEMARQTEQRDMTRQNEQREMARQTEQRETVRRNQEREIALQTEQRETARRNEERLVAQRTADRETEMASAAQRRNNEQTLPDSASPLALMALFGLLATAGAVTLRYAKNAIR